MHSTLGSIMLCVHLLLFIRRGAAAPALRPGGGGCSTRDEMLSNDPDLEFMRIMVAADAMLFNSRQGCRCAGRLWLASAYFVPCKYARERIRGRRGRR